MHDNEILWSPSETQIQTAQLTSFMAHLKANNGVDFQDYASLYDWSISEKEQFWSAVWDFCGVAGEKGARTLINSGEIEKALWFPDARLNFCENLLKQKGDGVAIYFRAEDKVEYRLTWDELRDRVRVVANWLKSVGIRPGDRVAGYMPNMPETIIAMLATTSLGGVWTSTSPDFGARSVVERFGQTEPKVLFAADGYYYNGKTIDIREKIRAVQGELSTVEHIVIVPLIDAGGESPGHNWRDILAADGGGPLTFQPMGFNDPLCILYSSGTTGKPKCIAHKVGGVLLQHLKELMLHSDVRPGDRVFYFTTCGWMMWNWLVSSLACKAAVVLYDGSPFYPDSKVLWDYADETGVTLFGTSAKYLDALKKTGLEPGKSHGLSTLRTLCSTGSVLVPESYDYVYESIKKDLCLASISGGTDIISCFVLGCPILSVLRGESQCRGLGMAVEVYDDEGNSITGRKGELVCTGPFPSQPLCFWGDPAGEKYHNAYYARFENVWHHGDYIELTGRGGVIIYGRSDATLNPGGVRLGTAEIYRYVEQLEAVQESIVVGQSWEDDERVVLFVVLRPGYVLDDKLEKEIRLAIRDNCTPRHVPAKILQVAEIPRTRSGKIVELAVREVIHGRPVKNISALANPEALELYRDRQELQ
jgi:acetoacetyl-CoA synthetase